MDEGEPSESTAAPAGEPGAAGFAAIEPPPAPQPAVAWGSPQPSQRPVPGAPGFEFAPVSVRFAAYFLDSLIVGIGSVVVSAILAFVPGAPLVTQLLVLAYFAAWWSGGRRATPGQRLFQLQVGNAFDGRNLTTEQSLRRAFVLILGGLIGGVLIVALPARTGTGASTLVNVAWWLVIVISAAMSPTRQAIHDRFAGTAVVRPNIRTSNDAAIIVVVVLVLVVAIPALAIISLIFLGSQVSDILSSVGSSV
ncbi:MAG TPA: RDD family protein [Candidatus Limnocylindria bacterium]|nr:RDD family protein [Candidatus Limnocylindria bacterium]